MLLSGQWTAGHVARMGEIKMLPTFWQGNKLKKDIQNPNKI
jgi:hypothetical protein